MIFWHLRLYQQTLDKFFGIDGKRLEEQYVTHLSNFTSWNQIEHAIDWILFAENIGKNLSIDKTSLSQGELYNIVTNKAVKWQKKAIVAMIKGTESEKAIKVLHKIKESARKKVKEVTLDLAPTMERIVRKSFPKAKLVSDRFHVQQLAFDAVHEIRINHRLAAIELENKEIELAKEQKRPHNPDLLENGDSLKQLLARSRYLLFKSDTNWPLSQVHLSEILFKFHPDLEQVYRLARSLSNIFSKSANKLIAFKKTSTLV